MRRECAPRRLHWAPLWVTPALGIGAALLDALTGACAVREWWRECLRADAARRAREAARRAPRALPPLQLWNDEDREALAEIGVRLPGESGAPGRRSR